MFFRSVFWKKKIKDLNKSKSKKRDFAAEIDDFVREGRLKCVNAMRRLWAQ